MAHQDADVPDDSAGSALSDVDRFVQQWREQRPDLDPSPIALFGRVHRVYLRYQAVITKCFEDFGLNPASFDVLAALRRAGAPYRMTGTELAAESLLSSAGITFRLDKLEQAGLITRIRDTQDRRVVHSQLTPEGLALIDEAIAAHLDNEHRLLAGVDDADADQLAALLQRLEDSILAARQ
ncbi:MarR family transcriptional regulator [Nocardioides carbamazepini]|jgi:DNA-binding MarR family transcriptional regulator|uniref:MarR family winged helix-turn-helix transcriptional regulator n=1 Tax=Nocardioides carbamazepini TaxID=2854259 RepID=UPI00214A7F99|nr:MarR family transcriptional regulator [Nocardioides carbamazepini]MCR1785705.1 MarR family transcriptional regulator [Nocardioides carbamazepini]